MSPPHLIVLALSRAGAPFPGGDTCFSKTSSSRVDHAVTTVGFKHHLKACNTLDTSLSTHRPIEATFQFGIQVVRVSTFTRTPRTTFIRPHGPHFDFDIDWEGWSNSIRPILESFRNDLGEYSWFSDPPLSGPVLPLSGEHGPHRPTKSSVSILG